MRAAVLFLLLIGCADAPPDAPARPERVVSLLPAWTAIIERLGCGDRLVACSEYCEPSRELPRIDWRSARAAEQVARLDPDLVVKQLPRAPHDPLQSALASLGLAVQSLPSETVADVRAAITGLADALGESERGRALVATFDARLAAATARVRSKPRPRVLFLYTRKAGAIADVGAAGPNTFIDELITMAGGTNALAAADEPYVQLDQERLVRLEPDVIIDVLPSEEDPAAVWRRARLTEARIEFVRDNALLIPGPDLPASVETLAQLIHGDS
ncbi:MAG: helical backbone metal receptor [Planctomycetota bacterium]